MSGNPCAGIEVQSTPVRRSGGRFSTTLELLWGTDARDVILDWRAPYSRQEGGGGVLESYARDSLFVALDVAVVRWQIESSVFFTRHAMDISWPDTDEIGLRFRSDTGQCVDEPTLVCGRGGCEIHR